MGIYFQKGELNCQEHLPLWKTEGVESVFLSQAQWHPSQLLLFSAETCRDTKVSEQDVEKANEGCSNDHTEHATLEDEICVWPSSETQPAAWATNF